MNLYDALAEELQFDPLLEDPSCYLDLFQAALGRPASCCCPVPADTPVPVGAVVAELSCPVHGLPHALCRVHGPIEGATV